MGRIGPHIEHFAAAMDPLHKAFIEAGLLLPEEIAARCVRCRKPMTTSRPAWCAKCIEETDPVPAAEREYWVKSGGDFWNDRNSDRTRYTMR